LDVAALHASVPRERTRNFSIIAHVDHGKSTLADRLMEAAGAIPAGGRKQYLDRLEVERQRGITVKAQTVSLLYTPPGEADPYLLNLVDTPGHVDFSYEVSRSLAACDGALLLVDACQGVQAQTLANFYLALEQDIPVVPVVNKIDAANAQPEEVASQMVRLFGVEMSEVLFLSAKTGKGVDAVLPAVVERFGPPEGEDKGELRALLLDSEYDPYRGAVCMVHVVDGALALGDKVRWASGKADPVEVMELGVMAPEPTPVPALSAGTVGYVIMGGQRAAQVAGTRVGDTLLHHKSSAPPLPGFKPARPSVFQGVFPTSGDQFDSLRAAVERLTLNDASVTVSQESSDALGLGYRMGFLGLLHADVFHQRLRDEFGTDIISTAPTVPYRVMKGEEWVEVRTPAQMPDGSGPSRARVEEPMVEASVMCRTEDVGRMVELCVERRGTQTEHATVGEGRVMMRYRMPLGEIAADFADQVKSRSSGYASFDYEDAGYEESDVVRLDMLVNGEAVDALACIVHRSKVQARGRQLASRLKELLSRQMFKVAIQASAEGKVLASEHLSAMRKDVTAKCYGGDVSRKKKLLEKQKEGKKRMKRVGSVDVPNNVFSKLLGSS